MKSAIDELQKELDSWSGEAATNRIYASAPARSELAGNHTDHEGGKAIAAALDCGIQALACPTDTSVARIKSVGYGEIVVDLSDLSAKADEAHTSQALVRGVASGLAAQGFAPSGFDMAMVSDVPKEGGYSSSAAFELCILRAMEELWGDRHLSDLEAAKIAQAAENSYFGKPSGLMDQLCVAMGGLVFMDFKDQEDPQTQKMDFDFEDAGYALVLVDSGATHQAPAEAYAAVPEEMHAVAHALGAKRLRDVGVDTFMAHVQELRRDLGDRAVLRARHFFTEDQLVSKRWEALRSHNMDEFLILTRRSGDSSAMFLQDVADVASNVREQPAMVAIAFSEMLLGGRGATRIHGGGFGGSVQAFVPVDILPAYTKVMNEWLGFDACRVCHVVPEGASAHTC
jgi:galactokinase